MARVKWRYRREVNLPPFSRHNVPWLRDTFFGKIKERLISMKVVNKRADKGIAKGQMISEGNCRILNFPKKNAHYLTI